MGLSANESHPLSSRNVGVGKSQAILRRSHFTNKTQSKKSAWSEKYEMNPISLNDAEGIISPSSLRITGEVRLMFSLDVQ